MIIQQRINQFLRIPGFKVNKMIPRQCIRSIYSIDGVFEKYLESSMMIQMEQHWRNKIKHMVKKSDESCPKYYVLSMFPYPSGKLHMGHVRVYTLSDTFAHYYRMKGYNVIHPMGWDAFGLPAENAAIENNVNPRDWTTKNIANMKVQLDDLGCLFDWDRELATCDPSYYKWTQHLFLQMYKAGLVYQRESVVNWDPVDQTVLADEQVGLDGCSWRSGAKVEKKPLKQWFFKTTKFGKSLLDGLNDSTLVNWRDVIKAQQNWIGKCDGTKIDFKVESFNGSISDSVSVWTKSPELICGTQFIVIHSEHILNYLYPNERLMAVNPFTEESVPIFVSDQLNFDYGSQTILGLPFVDEQLKEFAQDNDISCDKSVIEERNGRKYLKNSAKFSGMTLEEGREAVMKAASDLNIGGYPTSSNLQDWLISRQRYWGTPIPMVHCDSCGPVPVPEHQLPVELPQLDGLSVKGVSPLMEAKDWLSTECPKCGKLACRETDTMDTFVDSAWYFLRYLDVNNSEAPFSTEAAKNMPVDLYIGGKEHAYLHLYFARFITHFLHSTGKLQVREPFSNLITQGMVKARSYRVKGSKTYLKPEQIKEENGKYFCQETGQPLVAEWDKMSKSKNNGVDPSSLINKYGCDTVRMMMLTQVAPQTERNWSENEYIGIRNLQIKLWKLVSQALELQKTDLPPLRYDGEMEEYRKKLRDAKNDSLRTINWCYHHSRNTAKIMAKIHNMTSAVWATPGQVKRDAPEFQELLGTILICLAPIAPHFCSELWAGLSSVPVKNFQKFDWSAGVLEQNWPEIDPTFNIPVWIQGNGVELSTLSVAKWRFESLTVDDAFDLACHDSQVQEKALPHDIVEKEFTKNEDYSATLNIVFKRDEQLNTELSREELKKKRKEEKAALRAAKQERKAKREERIAKMKEVESKKPAKSLQKKYQ